MERSVSDRVAETEREVMTENFFENHDEIPKLVALEVLLLWKDRIEQRQYVSLLSTGKLWRARRFCDGCKGTMVAGDVRHLFRWDGKCSRFKSFFICPVCEERWEKLGDAGVPNCLPDLLNWSNWEPKPIDLTYCGDCCVEFTIDNPAQSIPTALKGPIYLLCGHCSKGWKDEPEQQTPGLAFTLTPVVASTGRAQ
jgi:hypothetical protein